MAKILVTGGAGMIGSNLVKRLVAENHSVVVIDNLWRGKIENLIHERSNKYCIDLNSNFFKYDLSRSISDIENFKDTEYLIHLADVVAGIDYVFNNQSRLFHQNLLINTHTIELARKLNVKKYIYAATACSFPEHLQNTFESKLLKEEELLPALPESSYGWSKLIGILEGNYLSLDFGIDSTSLILHNVYGAPCDYEEPRSQVIPSLIRKAINYPQEDFVVWGSGKQGRAFIHVDDIVNAFMLTLEKDIKNEIIQIGPDYCTTISQLAEKIVKISGKDIHIKFDDSKPEGDKSRAADYSRAMSLLGWKPAVDLEEGLRKTYDWIENQIKKNG